MKVFDLKVGYSCNNRCLHCVMETHRKNIYKSGLNLDCSKEELFGIIESKEFSVAQEIALTGGEPTFRADFFEIVKHIHDKFPDKYIAVQTNGKLLEQYIQPIFDIGANIHYVVALYGSKDIHNKIVNVGGDSFDMTMASIQKIHELYKDYANRVCTIKVVLSKANFSVIPGFCNDLHRIGIKNFAISYPHLNGFFEESPEYAATVGFSYEELLSTVSGYMKLAAETDCRFFFEEFPRCVFRDSKDALLKIPSNVNIIPPATEVDITVKYHEEGDTQNYNLRFRSMHTKPDSCHTCVKISNCPGIWTEAFEMFGSLGLKAITENEWEICHE